VAQYGATRRESLKIACSTIAAGIGIPFASFQPYMGHQWIFLGVFLLFVALGWLWSMSQRRKAVEKACEEIRRQVRREWSTLEHR
jgi:hypothetical protein